MKETKTSFWQKIPVTDFYAEHYFSPYNHNFDPGKRKQTFSFAYIVKGTVRFHSAQKNVIGCRGDFFYIPYGIRYSSSWHGENGTEHYCIHVTPSTTDGIFDDPYALQKVDCLSNTNTLDHIKKIYAVSGLQNSHPTAATLFFSLYSNVIQHLKKEEKTPLNEILANSIRYIENNYSRQLSVSEIAASQGVSESTLYHLFQKELATTPIKYYNKFRLEQAIASLGENLSIEDIAYRHGFESYGYFRELFKAHTGITPAQYRKRKF